MNVADAGTLVHVENIKQLRKHGTSGIVDSKQWDALRDVFTNDVLFYFESPTPAIDSADSFVAFISQRLATAVSVHHGHMPEISIIDDSNATGVWAMSNWVDDPDHGRAFQGYGHPASGTGAVLTATGASASCGWSGSASNPVKPARETSPGQPPRPAAMMCPR